MKEYYCKEKNCNNKISYIGFKYWNGRCRSCSKKGKLNPMYGKKRPEMSFQNKSIHTGKKRSKIAKFRMKSNHADFSREKHPQWKGGIKSLELEIRKLSNYVIWRKKVFERDNYTCQNCEQYGVRLEAHHIKSFKELYTEFLKEYNQFSSIEDKETLIRLATNWQPFWDIENGKTLCKDCHILITKE